MRSQRLAEGAALTYARHYGLFALVGTAGEDDLNAPDLPPRQLAGAGDSAKATASSLPSRSAPVFVRIKRRSPQLFQPTSVTSYKPSWRFSPRLKS